MYLDDLVKELRRSKYGCYLADIFLASVLYADDVCLLAPTRRAMQELLDICSDYASSWCIKYNEKKTKVMYFGKKFGTFSCIPIYLNGKTLDFVSEWKYLGVVLVTENGFYCSAKQRRSSFYRSSNSILNVLKKPSEQVLLKLLYSVCVPNLTYACDVANYHYKGKKFVTCCSQ